MSKINLHRGNCLEIMPKLEDNSIDLILTDPPFQTTSIKWDIMIPFVPMWEQLQRLIKPGGAIVLFCAQPFTSKLICSNLDWFKYPLVWQKTRVGFFAQAHQRFLSIHEDIAVFSDGGVSANSKIPMKYNPQGVVDIIKSIKTVSYDRAHRKLKKPIKSKPYGAQKWGTSAINYTQTQTGFPNSILKFSSEQAKYHPTQKPVKLLEYLIKTYSDEGDIVLDFTCGSGSTGVAAKSTNRDFIGIEMNEEYFKIAKERIHKHLPQLTLF